MGTSRLRCDFGAQCFLFRVVSMAETPIVFGMEKIRRDSFLVVWPGFSFRGCLDCLSTAPLSATVGLLEVLGDHSLFDYVSEQEALFFGARPTPKSGRKTNGIMLLVF